VAVRAAKIDRDEVFLEYTKPPTETGLHLLASLVLWGYTPRITAWEVA